jgi:imidazolonepropionase-like amidohydrolase
MGGPTFGLKTAIDEGVLNGPRIYPSGAVITVTSGHGDFHLAQRLKMTPNPSLNADAHRRSPLGLVR